MLRARGPVTGTLTENVYAVIDGRATLIGGRQVELKIDTPQAWCDYYGVQVEDGHALLYKGVEGDYRSPRGATYAPGAMPEASDWDGGAAECGGGLHFSPAPAMTHEFISNPSHYMGCWVRLDEMAVHHDGDYPQKCKARRVAKPCFEVDRDGEPLVAAHAEIAR